MSFLVILPTAIVRSQSATIDTAFRPIVSGAYRFATSITERSDGGVVVSGGFTIAGGSRNNMVGVLTASGFADPSFSTGTGPGYTDGNQSSIFSSDSQSTNKIIVGGNFNLYDGISRINIARLDGYGTVDMSFGGGQGFNSTVMIVKVLPDDKILVGGSFNRYNGQNVRTLVRLNSDGSLDTGFSTTPVLSEVRSISVQSDGRIVIASGASVVRLTANGAADPSFTTISGSSIVYDTKVQSDGKIVAVGSFTTFGGVTRRGVARLNSNGSLDAGFIANADVGGVAPRVYTVGIQSNGQILIGGEFTTINSVTRRYLARINDDGSLDTGFNLNFENTGSGSAVYSILVRADQSILMAGSIGTPINQVPLGGLVLINSGGSVNASFSRGVFDVGLIEKIVVQAGGKILLGGSPTQVNGATGRGIVRINADGTTDASFNTGIGVSGYVSAIAVQNDGRVIIGGRIDSYNGVNRRNLTRLNTDGSLDSSFPQGVNVDDSVSDIAIQNDGKIICVGTFFRKIIRLNPSGSLDTGFSVGTGVEFGGLGAVAIQPDGKIIIAGGISSYNGTPVNDVARINPDGTIDITFAPPSGLTGSIFDIALQSDGKVVIVGEFSSVNGIARNNIARLNPDGTTDLSFDPGSGVDGKIRSVILQPDGQLIIGGDFDHYNGVIRSELARVSSTGQLDPNFASELNLYLFDQLGFGPRIHAMALFGNDLVLGGIFSEVNGEKFGSVARYLDVTTTITPTLFDYDGDGRSDLSVRRPSDNIWYILRGFAGYFNIEFGVTGDLIAPADYDGDGKTDVCVFRPSNGTWYIFNSQSQSFTTVGWGASGDLPVPADHDGDGRADLVVFRPSTNTWYTRFANGTFASTVFGVAGDKPVVGDFDGDGKADIGLYRPSDNNWYILKTGFGFFVQTWGVAGDIPVPADYDGDGKTDVAVFRPSTGLWFRIQSTAGFDTVNWGVSGDQPIPADYDGDGKSDVAVFRESNATWYIVGSTSGQLIQNYGVAGDLPTQSAFIY